MRLADKIAVVTGGSQGIGAAIADLFLEEGATVVNGDVSVPGTEITPGGNPRLYRMRLDIADPVGVEAAFGRVIRRFGRIDILVNNAGICRDIASRVEETSLAEWRMILEINLLGTMHCINAALPGMRERRFGRIINMSSSAGENGGTAASIAYTASKSAIIGVTKVIARSEGIHNITANCIAPGYIVTEMAKSLRHDVSQVPLGRKGTALDVAAAALYLASDMGSYVTGTTMDVNGGIFMQ